jgi:ankyrin repeat protein
MNFEFIAPEEIAEGVLVERLNAALMLAIQANAYDVVDALLIAGANPSAKSADGKSALKLAIELEFTYIADLLKESGATE